MRRTGVPSGGWVQRTGCDDRFQRVERPQGLLSEILLETVA